jgi:O-antigen ligase
VAWALAGIKLLQENPLGYGLLTLSFERLSKQKWENSLLGLTHSGWIDFSLGYGILGLLLFIGASFGVWG